MLKRSLLAPLLSVLLVVSTLGPAQAADGQIHCSLHRWPYAFSYTPIHQNQPNAHIRDQVDGPGYQRTVKWEGGNHTTVAPWKWDSYTLMGSHKEAWCEN